MSRLKNIFQNIRTFFLSGLVTIFPISLTLFFISVVYNFVYRSLEPLRRLEPAFLHDIPGTEFLIATIFILLIGMVLRNFLVSTLVAYSEQLIAKIPIVRIVYSSAKILVDFFKVSDPSSTIQKRVVLIQYPREGNYHLAFLLESASDSYEKIIPDAWKKEPGEPHYKVFMPNSPNPTTGYFFILPARDIIHTDITFEEGIKTLVSCGLITPESLKNLSSQK